MPSLLLIDNYDSFTWNLYQSLASHRAMTAASVLVVRNDKLSLAEVWALNPCGIVISPGPGRPDSAGISLALPQALLARGKKGEAAPPLLGVCLGLQCLAQSCGGEVVRAKHLMHGKVSAVRHLRHHGADARANTGTDATPLFPSPLFKDVPNVFAATRYHSLVVERSSLPDSLRIDAVSDDEEEVVMALSHREQALFGVQFHPESIACEHGERILANFTDFCLVHATDATTQMQTK